MSAVELVLALLVVATGAVLAVAAVVGVGWAFAPGPRRAGVAR